MIGTKKQSRKMNIKMGDYIELRTGNVAKVVEIYSDFIDIQKVMVKLRVITKKGYTYQYNRPLGEGRFVERIINTEHILRLMLKHKITEINLWSKGLDSKL